MNALYVVGDDLLIFVPDSSEMAFQARRIVSDELKYTGKRRWVVLPPGTTVVDLRACEYSEMHSEQVPA